jgi:hypothetical protein
MVSPLLILIFVRGIEKFNWKITLVVIFVLTIFNISKISHFNNILSNESWLELNAPSLSRIHTPPLEYFENSSKVITLDGPISHTLGILLPEKKTLDSSHVLDYRLEANSSELMKFYHRVICSGTTAIILPAENWKHTGASDIIWYCGRDRPKNICDASLEAFRNLVRDKNIKYKEVGRVRSSQGVDVYVVYEVTRKYTQLKGKYCGDEIFD